MSKHLPKRSEVKAHWTWDLNHIYENEVAYEADVVEVTTAVSEFEKRFIDNLTTPTQMIQALELYEKIIETLTRTQAYANLPVAVDVTDSKSQNRSRQMNQLRASLSARLSFFTMELIGASENDLDAVVSEAPQFASFIRHIKQRKETSLHPEAEKALAEMSPLLNASLDTYETNKLADMQFGTFEVDGKTYPLSYQLYEDHYAYHPDVEVRREACECFYEVLSNYQHVNAGLYYTEVLKDKALATMRGYESVFDYLLDRQEVNQELYHRQIDMIMEDLAPIMRRYAAHLKEVHGLDKMTYADLKIDLDPEFSLKITVPESREYINDALAVLGKDYQNLIMRAYDERWVDYARNQGKQTGGFCSSVYNVHPYILMTWNDQLSDVYTKIHEFGHAGQSLLSEQNNSILGKNMSMYLVEGPSTFNELLLTHDLQEKAEDPREERYALANMIANTYFHNFITHLHEAAYQREVYRLIDAGQSFGAVKLNEIKRQVLEDFWGEDVEINPGVELTWMRQPHYYMGLYPYTYSAGLTIATQAFLKIRDGDEEGVERWLEFLALGDSKTPIEAAAIAGVDITSDKPLADTIAYLGESVDRLIELTHELEN